MKFYFGFLVVVCCIASSCELPPRELRHDKYNYYSSTPESSKKDTHIAIGEEEIILYSWILNLDGDTLYYSTKGDAFRDDGEKFNILFDGYQWTTASSRKVEKSIGENDWTASLGLGLIVTSWLIEDESRGDTLLFLGGNKLDNRSLEYLVFKPTRHLPSHYRQ